MPEARPVDDPPGDPRLARALHRHPHRAVRRATSRSGSRRCRRTSVRSPTRTSPTRSRSTTNSSTRDHRVELDASNQKIGAKIRDARLLRIPFVLVIGDREVKEQTVSCASAPTSDRRCNVARTRARACSLGLKGARSDAESARPRGRRPLESAWESPRTPPPAKNRVNLQIRVPEVRVLGPENEQLGVMTTDQARAIAREKRLRPRRGRAHGAAAGLQDHGLREVQVRAEPGERRRRRRSSTRCS